MELDYKHKLTDITSWLKQTVQNAGFTNVVIALSGGIDSAVSATLAVRALGQEHVYVLLLPYGGLSKEGIKDGKKVAEFLKLPKENVYIVDIQTTVDQITQVVIPNSPALSKVEGFRDLTQNKKMLKQVQHDNKIVNDQSSKVNVRIGNIMARIRMIYVYDFAKANNCLVIGTENKSEYYLGYFTRFGDEASDLEPIRNLYKTQVREMGKFLGIPEEIIAKAPTAGLWEGQTDEKEFGFSYEEADSVLYHYFDEGLPEEAISDLGIPKATVSKVLAWVVQNDFKHHLPKVFE